MVQVVQRMDSSSASLNFGIRKDCINERETFCKDVQPGHSRLLVCLGHHKDKHGFSTECRAEISKVGVEKTLGKTQMSSGNPMEEIQFWLESHRSRLDQYGTVLLGGTVGF